jgi:hypothetical protein
MEEQPLTASTSQPKSAAVRKKKAKKSEEDLILIRELIGLMKETHNLD